MCSLWADLKLLSGWEYFCHTACFHHRSSHTNAKLHNEYDGRNQKIHAIIKPDSWTDVYNYERWQWKRWGFWEFRSIPEVAVNDSNFRVTTKRIGFSNLMTDRQQADCVGTAAKAGSFPRKTKLRNQGTVTFSTHQCLAWGALTEKDHMLQFLIERRDLKWGRAVKQYKGKPIQIMKGYAVYLFKTQLHQLWLFFWCSYFKTNLQRITSATSYVFRFILYVFICIFIKVGKIATNYTC